MPNLTLLSPAKINLGLRIIQKRTDGYHDLDSIFVAIDLCDEIQLSPADHVEVTCTPAVTATPHENLVYTAALRLKESTGTVRGAKIAVTKRIPPGAGLGGGSSNAATTLLGLNTLWNLQLTKNELVEIAKTLGSDVAFFIHGGVAHVQGTGTLINPIDVDIPWITLVVVTGIHSSTAQAYAGIEHSSFSGPSSLPLPKMLCNLIDSQAVTADDFRNIGGSEFTNDFQRYVIKQHPEVGSICKELLIHGALFSSLTGSGSAVYGLFTTVENAMLAASALAPYQTYICRQTNRGDRA